MVSARRSSTGFFKVCAATVKFMFKAALRNAPTSPASDTGLGAEATPGTGNVSRNIGRLAGGQPAADGAVSATARWWVTATEPDTKGMGAAGLRKVAEPVWQAAVDAEAASIRDYAERAYGETIRSEGITVA
jgi:hypothetical protein